MNIQTMLEDQRQLQEILEYPMGHGPKNIRNNVLALIVEATEILNEFHWKPWRSQKHAYEVNRTQIAEEVADLLHFLMNILIEVGIDSEQIEEAWHNSCDKIVERSHNGY